MPADEFYNLDISQFRYLTYLDFVVELHIREMNMVKGVEFVVDGDGQKKAVLIDLKEHGDIWEDFYDTLRVKERESEPRESLAEVKKKVTGRS